MLQYLQLKINIGIISMELNDCTKKLYLQIIFMRIIQKISST
jgi:hypothetical protein